VSKERDRLLWPPSHFKKELNCLGMGISWTTFFWEGEGSKKKKSETTRREEIGRREKVRE